jgi:ABC-type transport system involved in multi-copper enzyme maturation permease subunit
MSGQIHDLGYKRYLGTRLAQSTRWRVIMREQIANGWTKWWRYKLALGGAVITACIAGGLLFFTTNKTIRGFGSSVNDIALTFADGVVPLSIPHFCRMAFVLSLTLGATIIANDTKSGAFTFYYVRSVRPRDYVLGKLMGYGFLVGTLVFIGPLLLAGFRLALSDDTDQLISYLPILPKVLGIGLLAAAAYTAMPLAISALVPNPRYALALWAAYYLIIGSIGTALAAEGIGGAAAAVDIQTALQAVALDWFDLRITRGHANHLDGPTAAIMLGAQIVLAIGIIWFQVSRDQRSGVGGSS